MPNRNIIKFISNNTISYKGNQLGSFIIRKILDLKSQFIFKKINKYLNGDKILDVGVGAGGIYCYLKDKGFDVRGIDVDNSSIFQEVKVNLYDGLNFPFDDGTFDTALLIHVLHHCSDGLKVLEEAKRVAKRVIVIEDTYRNKFEEKLVSAIDELNNWEFYKHPYHTSEWWQKYLHKKITRYCI